MWPLQPFVLDYSERWCWDGCCWKLLANHQCGMLGANPCISGTLGDWEVESMAGMNHLITDELEERLHYNLRNAANDEDLKSLFYDLIDEIIENRRRLDVGKS